MNLWKYCIIYNISKISGIMLLVSQNAENYDIILPNNAVFRINLAWCNTIDELEEKLSINKKSYFFKVDFSRLPQDSLLICGGSSFCLKLQYPLK